MCMGHFHPRSWTVLRILLNIGITQKGLLKDKKLSRSFGQSKWKFHVINSTLDACCSKFVFRIRYGHKIESNDKGDDSDGVYIMN